MRLFFDPADFEEIRGVVAGLVDFVPDDQQILAALVDRQELVGSAFAWGWGDSQVRDALVDALTSARLAAL